MSKTVDIFFDAVKTVDAIARELEALSRAFYTTGNELLSDHLETYAADLRSASKAVSGEYGKMCNERLNDAWQSTGNMMVGVLTGLAAGKESAQTSAERADANSGSE